MTTGKNGIELIKTFEGCKLTAYLCPANKWTIGYGHTGKVGDDQICEGMRISLGRAHILLTDDLKHFEAAVNDNVHVTITQNQFDALVAFAFNVGIGSLIGSTLLKKLNAKDYAGASIEFLKWNKATVNGVKTELKGLTRRRKAEHTLFNTK